MFTMELLGTGPKSLEKMRGDYEKPGEAQPGRTGLWGRAGNACH